jgi:hypothetical protein
MRRALLAVAAMLVPAALAAPPPPRPKPDELYFPTENGFRWVYDSGGSEWTLLVSAVEDKGTEKVVAISRIIDGKERPHEKYSVSKKGLALIDNGSANRLAGPICRLRLPARWGDQWVHCDGGVTYAFTVAGAEEVEVPAGKFKAVRVELEVRYERRAALRVSYWYAPEVGLVKSEVGKDKKLIVLKSFAQGKK